MQNDEAPTFEELLGFYRRKTTDTHNYRGSFLSQERLAALISEKIGYEIHRNKVGKWEKGKSAIHHQDERTVLLAIIAIFLEYGGIKLLSEADLFLETGGYRTLDDQEIEKISKWSKTEFQRKDPSIETAETEAELPELSGRSIVSSKEKSLDAPFLVPALPPQGIFGREGDLHKLLMILMLEDKQAENILPIALRGMGGIGKTTLAIALARLPGVENLFPDGILWTSLGPNPTIRLLQESWGNALGIDLRSEPNEAACRERLSDALHHRRAFLIVDDVWESVHGNFFKVAGPYCRSVFTTREVPVANDLVTRERAIRVDVLEPMAGLALLRKLAPEAVSSDEKSAQRLCKRLEFLPLALTLAGRLLANEVDVPSRMQRLVSELIEHREARLKLLQSEGRLGLDEENPVSIQAILGMSVERLEKNDQDRFAMLGTFGGDPLTWEINAAAHVWECKVEQAEDTVARFVQRGLVERRGNCYWMHALLADFAEEMMEVRSL